ncbi:hypothetical protein SELMODRAFT_444863 [Selaginella moellendorffii]|uniref:Outer envelope pore protein 24, chloroplastic n=1 Tax=Selaginella moellendorffii TaxID=88036 RepID=D8SDI8_SELML|nr:outer envelope pore protein 24, chloroplastic [Selaginella moellendorffii]EFJ17630.1 hypothetical protein SELMODRAFT_444863 [Selaginella moellendorffii]|eukprot:XP_002981442.1 outer envelope pore protein 24, chloroplastic [Selaginella moellendorffii]
MRASIKSKYEGGAAGEAATATLALGVGDLKLKASCTDATFGSRSPGGLAAAGVSLGVEKPGCFIIDHELQPASTRFQFMSAANVAGKQVKLTYIHPQKRNATLLEATLAVDPRNKLTAKYSFASGKGQLKYFYQHPSRLTLEPAYDFGTESWSFSASKKMADCHTLKLAYEAHRKVLGVEWISDDPRLGPFKVAASGNLDSSKPPKLLLEKTWNYEL